MQRELPALTLLLGSMLVFAVPPTPPQQAGPSVRDSAGVRIVMNPAAPAATSTLRIDAQPIFRVGFTDNDYIFETIEGATFLSDGSAVVANRGAVQELVVISPTGAIRAKLGRKGQGPGEFALVRDPITLGADTILAADPERRKLVIFHGTRFVRDLVLGSEGNLQPLGTTAQGKLLMGPWLGIIFGRLFETPWNKVPLVLMDVATGKADTVGEVDQEQSLNFGGRNPFKSQGATVASRGMFVTGRSDSPELRFIDATGRLRQVARWQAAKTAVHDTIWRNYSTRYGKAMRERTVQPVTEEFVQRFVGPQVKEGIKEPLPFFGDVRSDPDGNIWIADYAPRFNADPPHSQGVSKRFRVMAPNGQWIAEVHIPNTLHFRVNYRRVLAIGKDRLLALEIDSLGANGVAAYKLLRQ